MNNLPLGGGFGRRLPGYLDYLHLGVRIAKAMSPTPVKMIWSRKNDIQHDYYRPAAMTRFAGALDASGRPLAVASHYAGGGDGESVFMPYAIAVKEAHGRDARHPIRTGPWRSVLNSQHGFFKESFIDELAHAAKKDPYRFRLDLLGEQPRFRAVLERVAAMAGLGPAAAKGEGRGIAIAESFGAIVAEVAHVAVSPDGTLQVRQVFAAVDCGDVVNTDTATAQVEGGIIFGLSAAMVGEITIWRPRRGTQLHRPRDDPHRGRATVTVEFVQSSAPLGGLGEPGAADCGSGDERDLRGDRHPRARVADQEPQAVRESGVGSRESGVGSRESGVGSRESGVGSRESGVGSRESGVESRESETTGRH